MSTKSLSLVFLTCFAIFVLVKGNAIDIMEEDIVICPEGANGNRKTSNNDKKCFK